MAKNNKKSVFRRKTPEQRVNRYLKTYRFLNQGRDFSYFVTTTFYIWLLGAILIVAWKFNVIFNYFFR